MKKSQIRQITQSPLNAKQWLASLDCGHEAWITSKSRPKRLVMRARWEKERAK